MLFFSISANNNALSSVFGVGRESVAGVHVARQELVSRLRGGLIPGRSQHRRRPGHALGRERLQEARSSARLGSTVRAVRFGGVRPFALPVGVWLRHVI